MRVPLMVAANLLAFAASCGGELSPDELRSAPSSNVLVGPAGGLSATAVSLSEIDLDWQQSSTQVSGWQLYRSPGGSGAFALIASLPATPRSYADTGLQSSTSYCYQVRAWRTVGKSTSYSSFVGPACATTFTPPPPPPPPLNAPSGVTAVPQRIDYADPWTSGVALAWKDNSGNEDGFRIERADGPGGPWTQRSTTGPNVTSVLEYGIREEPVCFRIVAFSASAGSNPSDPACTVPPASPTDLSARATDHGIDLSWSDNSAVEDGYAVSRTDPSGTWSDIATLPANATSYSDTAVSADVTYTYRVRALKDGGASDFTNSFTAVLSTSLPVAPLDLVATYYADDYGWLNFNASWTDASSNEAGFRLEASPDGISGWGAFAFTQPNQAQYFTRYDLWVSAAPFGECYRVVAFNSQGDSAPSNAFCTGWGEAPGDVAAAAIDAHTIDLSWTDTARFEDGYYVMRSTSTQGPWDVLAGLPADSTGYRDTGLMPAQEYWYIVGVTYPQNPYSDSFEYVFVSATTPSDP